MGLVGDPPRVESNPTALSRFCKPQVLEALLGVALKMHDVEAVIQMVEKRPALDQWKQWYVRHAHDLTVPGVRIQPLKERHLLR